MDLQNTLNVFTVQGRDTPVPVGDGGDRAGPARPSASDCLNKKDVFKKSTKLFRSPAKVRSSSCGGSIDCNEKLESHSVKRRREIDFDEQNCKNTEYLRGDAHEILLEVVKGFCNAAKDFHAIVKEMYKPKNELTVLSSVLFKYAETCERKKLIEKLEKNEFIEPDSPECKNKKQKNESSESNTREMATQTMDVFDLNFSSETTKNKEAILHYLGEPCSYETSEKICEMNWQDELFKATSVKTGNPITYARDDDVVIFRNLKEETVKGIAKQIQNWYPDVGDILISKNEPADIKYVVNKTITSSKEVKAEKEKYFYVMPYSGTSKNCQDNFKNIVRLRDMLKEHKRNKAVIILPLGEDHLRLRKLLEYVFNKEDVELVVHTQSKSKREIKALGKNKLNKKTKYNTEAIIVKSEGKTYADLLKTMKEEINLKQIGATINKIKKTRTGDMLLVLENEKGKAELLSNEIKKIHGTQVRTGRKQGEYNLFLTGLDAVTTMEEINGVIGNVSSKEETFNVLTLKPTQSGNQVATLKACKSLGEKLLNMERIVTDWASWKIKEQIHLKRCYNCLELGHTSQNCKNLSRANTCIRCGKVGHKVKDCENSPHCFTCNTDGHRADSSACPTFRRAMNSAIQERSKHRKNSQTVELEHEGSQMPPST